MFDCREAFFLIFFDEGSLAAEQYSLLLDQLLKFITVLLIKLVLVAAAFILYFFLELFPVYFQSDHEVTRGRHCMLLKVAESTTRKREHRAFSESTGQHIY